MQTLTVELTGKNSLKALQMLEEKHLIRIFKEHDLNTFALPGNPVSIDDFREWVRNAENSPAVSLTEAKEIWEAKKTELQNLIR